MSVETGSGGGAARNFMKVLELINRTILPRRLSLSNGTTWLVLIAARQQAWMESAGTHSAADVAKAITNLCAPGDPVRWGIEALETEPKGQGHSAIAIVNAQAGTALTLDGVVADYRFRDDGWPLVAPTGATFASLNAASRIAAAMSRWTPEAKGEGTTLFALAEGLPQAVSVAIDGGPAIISTPPGQLGQIVSRWRGKS
jgi:hypothetical protein